MNTGLETDLAFLATRWQIYRSNTQSRKDVKGLRCCSLKFADRYQTSAIWCEITNSMCTAVFSSRRILWRFVITLSKLKRFPKFSHH